MLLVKVGPGFESEAPRSFLVRPGYQAGPARDTQQPSRGSRPLSEPDRLWSSVRHSGRKTDADQPTGRLGFFRGTAGVMAWLISAPGVVGLASVDLISTVVDTTGIANAPGDEGGAVGVRTAKA